MEFDLSGTVPKPEIVDFFERARDQLLQYSYLDEMLPRGERGFTYAAGKVAEQADRYRDPFRLVVVGEFNAGKSALINALLGRPGFVREGVTPTTGSITEIWWDSKESGEVYDSDGNQQHSGDLATAMRYADQRTEEAKRLMSRGRGARIVARTDARLVRNLVLIDTPGLGASARDDEVTYGALDLADAAIIAVSALQPGGEDTIRLGEWLRTHGRRVLLAVTRSDQAADPDEAFRAATALLTDVTYGEPILVNAPAIYQDLAALEAAEEARDETEAEAARVSLEAHGYTPLLDRLQGDFGSGDAGRSRLRAAQATLQGHLRQLTDAVGRASASVELELEQVHSALDDLDKRLDGVLPAKADFLDGKIDEAVDVRVAEFIARLTEAVELFIDKIADRGVKGTVQALEAMTKSGRQRVDGRVRRDFADLFPDEQLEIAVDDLTRAVETLTRAEWGGAAMELSQVTAGQRRVNVEAISRDIMDKLAAANAEVLAKAAAFVGLLFAPGGIVLGAAILVMRIFKLKPKKRKDHDVTIQKREARNALRNERAVLTFNLGSQYRQVNHDIRDMLREQLRSDRAARDTAYIRVQEQLASLGAASGELSRLAAAADELLGQRAAW